MDEVETTLYLEAEKDKCLKNIQNFYKKYGSEKIENLRTYLIKICETISDEKEIQEIKKQLDLLEPYC
jgi:hypothetical protein